MRNVPSWAESIAGRESGGVLTLSTLGQLYNNRSKRRCGNMSGDNRWISALLLCHCVVQKRCCNKNSYSSPMQRTHMIQVCFGGSSQEHFCLSLSVSLPIFAFRMFNNSHKKSKSESSQQEACSTFRRSFRNEEELT